MVTPWTTKISRAISKNKKIYLMDYASIETEAIRFENMVALELYRAVNTWNDRGWGTFTLHYVRNKEKEEVDFLIAEKGAPLFLIEAKLNDEEPSKPLRKFQKTFNIPAIQLVNKVDVYKIYSNDPLKILIVSAYQWLAGVP